MTLLPHIESLIKKLENNEVSHCFLVTVRCNVGLLVREVLGLTDIELEKINKEICINCWDYFVSTDNDYLTNSKQHEFISLLSSKGLTPKVISELEMLSNKEIIEKTGVLDYLSKDGLIKYLKEWANILKN